MLLGFALALSVVVLLNVHWPQRVPMATAR
jgi:hypothetical protein